MRASAMLEVKGRRILIDCGPDFHAQMLRFGRRSPDDRIDTMLATHQHYDHTATDLPARKPGCVVWENFDLHPRRGEYLRRSLADVTVQATVAFNENHPIDECVGYLVWMDGVLVYCAGDTSETRQMSLTLSGMGYTI